MFINARGIAILAIAALLAGCSYFSTEERNGTPCVLVRVTHKPAPVIAELGYEDIQGRQESAVYQGGFQHALVIPLAGRVSAAGEKSTLKTDNETVYFLFNHALKIPVHRRRLFGGLLEILANLLEIPVQDLQRGVPHEFGEGQDIHSSAPAFDGKCPAEVMR